MEKCTTCNNMLEVIKDRSYHYKESGLDYVWLIGILQYKCKKCGNYYVEIPRINDLHLLIGKNIVCKKRVVKWPRGKVFAKRNRHEEQRNG